MKNQKTSLLIAIWAIMSFICVTTLNAQSVKYAKRVAVLSVKANNVILNSKQVTKLFRNSLIELDTFEVLGEYDMLDMLSGSDIVDSLCYSTSCLVKAGEFLNVDYMISGSIEKLIDKIVVSFWIVDVKRKSIVKQKLIEYIDVDERLKEMIKVSLKELLNLPVDVTLKKALVKENQFASNINIPDVEKLSLSGPRIGFTFLTGDEAQIVKDKEEVGGFEGRPAYFQFGYQFEVSYLNAGRIQALFEIIPVISGVDQGLFIPSLTLLNGVRLNTNGLEFAVGPTFIMTRKAEGYYDESGNWQFGDIPDGKAKKYRLDSRGDPYLDTGFVVAVGKSFKSGKVNFPVNIFTVLKKKDLQFGLSLGFNASNTNKKNKR